MSLRPATFLTTLAILCLLALQVTLQLADTDRAIGVRFHLSSSGLEIESLLRHGPARTAGLLPGDRVLEVAGRPTASLAEYNRRASGFERGRPVSFRVARAGRELAVEIAPGVAMDWRTPLLNLFAVLGHLGVALIAGAERSRDVRARLLALLSFAIAAEISLPAGSLTVPALALLSGCLFYALIGLQSATELHLLTVLPERRRYLERLPWLPQVFYGAGLLFAAVGAVAELGGALPRPLLPFGTAALDAFYNEWFLPVWALAVTAWFLCAALRWDEPRGRQQSALMFLSNLPWAIFTVAGAVLTHLDRPTPGWLGNAVTFALLCYAAGVLYAIFQAHLLGFAVVVRRSLVYFGLSAALLAVFYLVVVVGGALFNRSGAGLGSIWLLAVASLMLGVAFGPLKARLQRVIDRRFFPREESLPQSVAELERLVHIATADGLTGLPRREIILQQLAAEVRRATRHKRALSLALLDLDHFKVVNDRYGHLMGDALLAAVAHALRQSLRATDLIGRYGGEEFLVVLPETELAGARRTAEKLRRAVAEIELPHAGLGPVRTTISAGLASLGEVGGLTPHSAEALIAAADAALYRAKAAGRNRAEVIVTA